MDIKKEFFSITESQYRFLCEWLNTGDVAGSLKAGGYSTKPENMSKNFDDIMDRDKVQWALAKMTRLHNKGELQILPVFKKPKKVDPNASEFDKLMNLLDRALVIAEKKSNAAAMGAIVKTVAELRGLYQPKKVAQKVLSIQIQTEFDKDDQGGSIDYEDDDEDKV